jgi:Myb-like DNA-binding domain
LSSKNSSILTKAITLHSQAVAKHGQKWDLVQKALPSRGYHQVRQRWLRKLGVFDSKPDLSSFQTGGISFPPGANIVANGGPSSGSPTGSGGGVSGDSMLLPQPKLGLAPLSSELAFSRK